MTPLGYQQVVAGRGIDEADFRPAFNFEHNRLSAGHPDGRHCNVELWIAANHDGALANTLEKLLFVHCDEGVQ